MIDLYEKDQGKMEKALRAITKAFFSQQSAYTIEQILYKILSSGDYNRVADCLAEVCKIEKIEE